MASSSAQRKDLEDMAIEDKCEHLMNIVVESRKRFGKMCIDYERKISLIENKNLNLQLETISNYRFKPKTQMPIKDTEATSKEVDVFSQETLEKRRRIDELKKNLTNTQRVILQLNGDRIGRKLKEPITAEAMLAAAKNKTNI